MSHRIYKIYTKKNIELEQWDKLPKESEASYDKFRKYLEFEGTLEEFSVIVGISAQALRQLASRNKWRARKDAFLSNRNNEVETAFKEQTQTIIKDAFLPFEAVCNKIANRLLEIVSSSDDLLEALPPAKMLDGIKTLSTALKACAELKAKTEDTVTQQTKLTLEFVDSKKE